jgi:hypothetical protein
MWSGDTEESALKHQVKLMIMGLRGSKRGLYDEENPVPPRGTGFFCCRVRRCTFGLFPCPAEEVGAESRRKKGGWLNHKEEELTQGIRYLPTRLRDRNNDNISNQGLS